MNKKMIWYIISVATAPVIFWVYWNSDLVCLPRAIFSSFIFGVIPLIFLLIALKQKREFWFYITKVILLIEMVVTPVIMLRRLGWEMFVEQRLLAFFTFEGFALFQLILVLVFFREFLLNTKQ